MAAARRRNSGDLLKRGVGSTVGEELQSQKGEDCGTPGPSVKRSPTEYELNEDADDDISDLLGSDDEGGKEIESQHIVEELLVEILNKVGQSCGSAALTC